MTNNRKATKQSVYRVMIDAPIDVVWNQLVKTDEILPFFFGSVCKTTGELTVGAPIAMETKSGKYRSVVGKVLEFDPPFKYAHTFKFTGYDDAPCVVEYELKERQEGVEFTLTTSQVPAGSKTEKSMAQGGPFIVKTFKSVVETGKANLGGRIMLSMISLFEPFSPKVCKSENWPFEKISTLKTEAEK